MAARRGRRPSEEPVRRILDAALAEFARYGLAGSRIDRIAAAAGLSKPNLLYYFRTKELLYRAVLERTLAMWLEPLRELDPDDDPADALAGYITRKLQYSHTHPEGSRLFAMEVIQGAPYLEPVLRGELAALVEAKVATIRSWIASGKLAPVDPHHLLFMLWATTQHYADFAAQVRTLTGHDLDDDAFLADARAAVVGVVLQGVLPRP
jgi:TetR/AcrR family transcriptional regulator